MNVRDSGCQPSGEGLRRARETVPTVDPTAPAASWGDDPQAQDRTAWNDASAIPGGRRRGDVVGSMLRSARTEDFRQMMDESFFPILVHRDFRPLYANMAYARLNGFVSVAEVLALPTVQPLIAADQPKDAKAPFGQLGCGERTLGFRRHRYLKPNGEQVWVSLFDQLIEWKGEAAVQVTLSDITDKVEAETALKISEARLQSVLRISPFPVVIARATDYGILFKNDQACRLLGAEPDCISGHFANTADWQEILKFLYAAGLVRDFEVQMTSGPGGDLWVLLSAVMMVSGREPAILISFTDITQRKLLERELTRQATTDGLTGCYNRRHFMLLANQEFQRARRYRHPFSVLMVDIDHFKSINDSYGHAAGDDVIRTLVRLAVQTLRDCDIIGRIGGEEFVILLPETPISGASGVAERLRGLYSGAAVSVGSGTQISFTASIGVAQQTSVDANFSDTLNRADIALYKAKADGRNRVVVG